MSSLSRNRWSAVGLILGALLLPLPAAAEGPLRLEQGWERMWDGLFAWLGLGQEDGATPLTGWSSSSIDPLGQPQANQTGGAETESSSYIDPLGEDR